MFLYSQTPIWIFVYKTKHQSDLLIYLGDKRQIWDIWLCQQYLSYRQELTFVESDPTNSFHTFSIHFSSLLSASGSRNFWNQLNQFISKSNQIVLGFLRRYIFLNKWIPPLAQFGFSTWSIRLIYGMYMYLVK